MVRRASTSAWFNRQRETVTVRRPEWGKTMFDDDRITVAGIQGQVDLAVGSASTIGLALQGSAEGVDARRKEVRDENVTFYQRGRFPGGTVGESFSATVENRWTVSPETIVRAGVSWSADRRRSNYGPSVFRASEIGIIDRTFTGLSWFADASRRVGPRGEVYVSVSSTFAAPGLDDIASNAYWFAGRDVPNPDIEGERAMRYEASYRVSGTGSAVRLTMYRIGYSNLIGRSWYGSGPDGMAGSTDDLFQFGNGSDAVTTGVEFAGDYVAAEVGSYRIGVAATSVLQHVSAGPEVARFAPPVVYRLGIRLEREGFTLEPYVRGAARTAGFRAGPAGSVVNETPAWNTFNLRLGLGIGGRTTFNLAVENVADARYREHGSYLDAAGRNLVLALSYSL